MRRLARAPLFLLDRLGSGRGRDRVAAMTGIAEADWERIAAAFPWLPPRPGKAAARVRARLRRLASRALSSGDWSVRLEGEPPGPAPSVFVSAHLGSLQALRYVLRARGVPAATVIGRFNLDRRVPERSDAIFDRRFGLDFPHALPSIRPHRLRSALKRGSLIAAADLPEGPSRPAEILGGRVSLDPRPFRLARVAGVECRAAFLTLPEEGWTLTVSPALPAGPNDALEAFAALFAEVARRAPLDLDGPVYRALAGGRTGG